MKKSLIYCNFTTHSVCLIFFMELYFSRHLSEKKNVFDKDILDSSLTFFIFHGQTFSVQSFLGDTHSFWDKFIVIEGWRVSKKTVFS